MNYSRAAKELVGRARRELLLGTAALAREYYDGSFVDALRGFLLSSDRARLRVLVVDPRAAATGRSGPIALGLQLSSRVEFRDLSDAYRSAYPGEQLIVDRRHLLEKPQARDSACQLRIDAPQDGRRAAEAFERAWEDAIPSVELRNQQL